MNEKLIIIGQFSLCAVLLALVTIWLNHLLANTRDKVKCRREKGAELISAFRQELDALIQTDEDCRLILTDEAYRQHDSAVRAFMPYISWIDKYRMKQAWGDLALFRLNKKHAVNFYAQYADCGSLDKRKAMRPLAINRIQGIIRLAQK